jgi:hypothetical protein
LTLAGKDLNVPVPLLHPKGLQSYFVSFVKHGDPNVERGPGTIAWDRFGEVKSIVDITHNGFRKVVDEELPDERCGFWQNAPYE